MTAGRSHSYAQLVDATSMVVSRDWKDVLQVSLRVRVPDRV